MGYLVNMLPYQIERAVKEKWPAVITSGSIELHGSHLPVGTDLILVEEIVKRVEPQVDIVVCPSIAYGPTGYAVGGPKTGTVDVRAGIFKESVKDILLALYKMGFRHIIVIQHHQGPDGPQGMAFKMAAAEIFNETKDIYGEAWWTNYYKNHDEFLLKVDVLPLAINEHPLPGGHGGFGETEPMMVLKPETVEMDKLKPGDYPWNWDTGSEANKAAGEYGAGIIESLVKKWVQYIRKV